MGSLNWNRFAVAGALTLAIAGPALQAKAGSTVAFEVKSFTEDEPGSASFKMMKNSDGDLEAVIYASPNQPQPRVMTYEQIVSPPQAEKSKFGGLVVAYREERPVVVLIADHDHLDPRVGGELTLKFLHDGHSKKNPKFRQFSVRLVRDGNQWKMLSDDHSTRIQTLCFTTHSWGPWTVGAEHAYPNPRQCPPGDQDANIRQLD